MTTSTTTLANVAVCLALLASVSVCQANRFSEASGRPKRTVVTESEQMTQFNASLAAAVAKVAELEARLGQGEKNSAGRSKGHVHHVARRSDDAGQLQVDLERLTQQLTQVTARMTSLEAKVAANAHTQDQQETGSSTYVHWGRSTCPSHTDTVYSGVVAGGYYNYAGAAANFLCATLDPVFSSLSANAHGTQLYGAEYQTHGDASEDQTPVCALCRAPLSTTVMIPATNQCPTAWTRQYNGFLMAGSYSNTAASEYICMDSAFESYPGTEGNQNGKLLYFVATRCGSLPCSPYKNLKIVTCVVCSK